MKWLLNFLLLLLVSFVHAQDSSFKKLTVNAFAEVYYSYDFSNPPHHQKPSFLYNHKRHNEINCNLLMVKAVYSDSSYRGNLGVMAGNYAEYNLAAEPAWAQFIYEANAGIRLSKKRNIWLDAGILPSHIGFESAISADCWTLTRSLLAENSPYYEAGIRLSYTSKNEQLYLSALYLNGWQKIRRPVAVQRPSFGVQVNYKPSAKLTLNYSNFIGSDQPDSLKALRLFHNLYMQYEPSEKFGIIAGFDIGSDKTSTNKYATWYSPVIIIRQSLNKKTRVAIRAEYYSDEKQLLLFTGTPNGFTMFGFSTNFDYDINKKIKVRLEGKMYRSGDVIFEKSDRHNYSITTNMAIKL